MKILISLIISLLLCISIYAHQGGHYHRSTNDYLNSWTLLDGSVVKGNFSMLKDGLVYLEEYEGKYLTVSLDVFSEASKKIISIKVRKAGYYNGEISKEQAFITKSNFYDRYFWYYLVLFFILIFAIIILGVVRTSFTRRENQYLNILLPSFIFLILIVLACKKASTDSTASSFIPKSRTSFIDSAFAPYKPSVNTSFDNTYFYVSADGFPQHNMMIGIVSWQQQVPIAQSYSGSNSWSIPLQPVYAQVPLSTRTNFMKGAVAIAVNGIPIFNALNNRGVDSYATGELDNWGGHCGRADDYHYHAAPLHLSGTSGLKPIAFALDGFAVYGQKEPDGSTMNLLDSCHGHLGINGVYHYHGTTTYPYVIGAMKGKVSLDPTTVAPENQILPQAFATPVRPALTPLSGATITDFMSVGTNAYKLTYQRGNKYGFVEYNWTSTNLFTYKLTDTSGAITINTYQR